MNAATHFAPTCNGRTLFRFVLKIGRTYRTGEQWHTSQETAENAAKALAAEYAEGRRYAVLHVYPCPGFNREHGVTLGGPWTAHPHRRSRPC